MSTYTFTNWSNLSQVSSQTNPTIHLDIQLNERLCFRYYEAKHNLSNTTPKTVSNPLAPKQVTSFLELRDTIFPMLYTIGSYLSYDPELVYKIIRLLKLALIQVNIELFALKVSGLLFIYEIISGWSHRAGASTDWRFVVFWDTNCARFINFAHLIRITV